MPNIEDRHVLIILLEALQAHRIAPWAAGVHHRMRIHAHDERVSMGVSQILLLSGSLINVISVEKHVREYPEQLRRSLAETQLCNISFRV